MKTFQDLLSDDHSELKLVEFRNQLITGDIDGAVDILEKIYYRAARNMRQTLELLPNMLPEMQNGGTMSVKV